MVLIRFTHVEQGMAAWAGPPNAYRVDQHSKNEGGGWRQASPVRPVTATATTNDFLPHISDIAPHGDANQGLSTLN